MIWEAVGKVIDIEVNQSFAVYYKIPQLKEYRQLLYESDVLEMFSFKSPKKIVDLYVTVEETGPPLQCEVSKGKMLVTRKGGKTQNMGWTEPAFEDSDSFDSVWVYNDPGEEDEYDSEEYEEEFAEGEFEYLLQIEGGVKEATR